MHDGATRQPRAVLGGPHRRRHPHLTLRGLQGIEGQIRLIARGFESNNREGALVLVNEKVVDGSLEQA